jgi:hypothetical protein
MYAADPESDLDGAVIEHDLTAIFDRAREAGFGGVVLALDDASSLTEDIELVEELVSSVDAITGYRLLLAGLPTTAGHFVDSASPCLSRFLPVWLRPFRGLHQVYVSLSAPLGDGPNDKLVEPDDVSFLRDVLRLTGGNPYELMLVAHHLWLTCQRGEQERYVLTPRVLDRVIPHIAIHAAGGDALLDGANAIDRLPEEHVRQAVELASFARLSTREIAIARTLGIATREAQQVDRHIATADIDHEVDKVVAELEELESEGVVQLHDDREHNVVGGPAAAVLLKYKARARLGADISNYPFELGFLSAVGPALIRDATEKVLETNSGITTLGFSLVMSQDGAGRLSPRPAIRALSSSLGFERLVQAEVDLMPWGVQELERFSELLSEDAPTVALVYTSVAYGREQLEYTELWEVPSGFTQEDLAQVWSSVIEEWQPIVSASDLGWIGSEFVVLSGEEARQVLVVLQRYAATSAVQRLFGRWVAERDVALLARAQTIADEAVLTLRATGLSEAELGGELSGLLSRAGFLKSFDDSLLAEARTALEDAIRTGTADSWVTNWNLANVAARQGDLSTALALIDGVVEDAETWRGQAFILFFVPGRPPERSLLNVGDAGILAVVSLQRAILEADVGTTTAIAEALGECDQSNDEAAQSAASWVTETICTTHGSG